MMGSSTRFSVVVFLCVAFCISMFVLLLTRNSMAVIPAPDWDVDRLSATMVSTTPTSIECVVSPTEIKVREYSYYNKYLKARKPWGPTANGWNFDWNHIKELIGPLQIDSEDIILDVGCGNGWLLHEILFHYNPKEAHGLDPNAVMIEKARQHMGTQAKLCVGFGNDLQGLPTNYFTKLIEIYPLNHMTIDETKHAIRDSFRVLKPGGRLCFSHLNGPDMAIDTNPDIATGRPWNSESKPYSLFFEMAKELNVRNPIIAQCHGQNLHHYQCWGQFNRFHVYWTNEPRLQNEGGIETMKIQQSIKDVLL